MNFNESKQRLRNCPCDAKSPLDTEIINQCFLLDFDRQAFGALVLNERHSGNEDDSDEEEEDVQRRRDGNKQKKTGTTIESSLTTRT